MVGAPSSNASPAGLSARRANKRGAGTPANRVRAMVRMFHLLAFAILTIVCAGVMSSGRSIATLVASIDVVVSDGANAARWGSAQASPREWCDCAAHPVDDLQAMESDIDDGDDSLCAAADEAAVAASRLAFPRTPGRSLRSEAQIDTSRFAIGTGLPRGPPA